jgi:hypothetical protein
MNGCAGFDSRIPVCVHLASQISPRLFVSVVGRDLLIFAIHRNMTPVVPGERSRNFSNYIIILAQ